MENLLFYLVFFIFGAIVGSFLNCLVYRLHNNEDFLVKRSYCPHCRHILSALDLVPVFGFLFLRGKCRYCREKISIQYLLAEIATGLLFVMGSFFYLSSLDIFYYLLATSFLVIIFIYDFKYYLIPDKVIFPAIVISFIYQLISNFHFLDVFYSAVFSALAASGFFLAIFLVSRGRWIGFGDVKLALFLGLCLNFPNILVALFLAFFIGAIIGIGLIILQKKGLKSEVPFGPFLVLGTFISLFWGARIFNWYIGLLR